MLQKFDPSVCPEQGPPRLRALRGEMAHRGLSGFIVPRADAHQGEFVAPCDERLSWLTGFTGSAGFCVVLRDTASIFVDGRYRIQVKAQVAEEFTPVDILATQLGDWLVERLESGERVGFDPWLHTVGQIAKARKILKPKGIILERCDNLIDAVWDGQPSPPCNPVRPHPIRYAGETSLRKCARLADELARAGHAAAVLTIPESIMWLLNIRGSDIRHTPVAHGFAVLHSDRSVDLFMDANKLDGLHPHLDDFVRQHSPGSFLEHLDALKGPVRIDPSTCPQVVADRLGKRATEGTDPCTFPKARKNPCEIEGMRQAHLRDGVAMAEFLAWLDSQPPGSLTEIDVVTRLEEQRKQDTELQDISFETIAGTGGNGAVIHYRVTRETNTRLEAGDLLVLDSGGQYLDGTTDITRTLAVGDPGADECRAYTRVLQALIHVSRLRWPAGRAGRDLDCVGRIPLWLAGQDFDHGLGHGVGAFLSVHEGPQRFSPSSSVPLEPGMILSNEPGYYREGAFGIRLENLVVIREADPLPDGDRHRKMLCCETLTLAPFDRRLIVTGMLSHDERSWLDSYHAMIQEKIAAFVDDGTHGWLEMACAPL